MTFMYQNRHISTTEGGAASFRLTLLLFTTISCQMIQAQDLVKERKYEIAVLGFTIGGMTASRDIQRDTTIYKVKSNVSFWFFGKVNAEIKVDSRTKSDQVVWSRSTSSTNKGDFKSEVKWNGSSYDVDASSYKFDNDNSINYPISISSVMLFFNEPKGNEDFLGEVLGLVSKVKRIANNGYEVNINGNTNRYYYHNGVMVKAEMSSPIKNYIIKLVE